MLMLRSLDGGSRIGAARYGFECVAPALPLGNG
jgi:hypothetical protein